MQIADAERCVFLRKVGLVETLRPAEGIVDMEMTGDRRHGTKLFTEVQATISGFEICMAEVDQRHDIVVADSLNGRCHLSRCLAVLAGFGGEDIFERNPHTIGPAEFREFEKRVAFTMIGLCPLGDLVSAQRAAMLDNNTRTDAVTENGKRLRGIDLVAAGHRIHEVG